LDEGDTHFGQNGVMNEALLAFVAEAYDVALQGQNLVIVGYGRDTSAHSGEVGRRFRANAATPRSGATQALQY
jgi:hypothetical protein